MQITTDEKVLSRYDEGVKKGSGRALKAYAESEYNAAFAMRHGANEWWGSSGEPCHNAVGYSTINTEVLINAFTKQKLPNQTVLIDYLLDLYKGAMDDNTILVKDKSSGNYKFILFEKFNEKDIKLTTSFLIASRLHQQFFLTPFFIYLQEQGFSPDTAFILLHTYSTHAYFDLNKTTLVGHIPRHADQTLYVVWPGSSGTKYYTDPTLIYNRKPSLFGSLKTGQTPQPCNLIWSSGKGESCIKTIPPKLVHNPQIVRGVKGYAKSIHSDTIKDCYNTNKPLSKDIVNYIETTWRKGEAIE